MLSQQLSLSNLQVQSKSSTRIIDTPCLFSRNLPGWNGIELRYYQASPGNIQRFSQHLILVFFSQGEVKQKFKNSTQLYAITPGSIIFIPASALSQISWLQPLNFAALIFQKSAVKQAEEIKSKAASPHSLNRKSVQVELKPQFKQTDGLVYNLVSTLLSETSLNRGDRLYGETLTKTLAIHLFQNYSSALIRATENKIELPPSLNQAIAYINENLDKNLRLEEIAAVVNISKYYFCNLFRQSMGISPYQYLLQQRIEKSKTLLHSDLELSIADISLRCGFANQSHLSKCFRKFTGDTPKAYRNRRSDKTVH